MATKRAYEIRQVLRPPKRYLRSTSLDRDFADPEALDSYTVTPFVEQAFLRIIEGAKPGSGRRAWRITGDYGVGKSSFALFLAHFMAGTKSRGLTAAIKDLKVEVFRKANMIPVLVTGEREGIIKAAARAIARTFGAPRAGRPSKARLSLISTAEKISRSGAASAFSDLLDNAIELATEDGAGILLIVDEMGKFLEHAANHPETEDIFVLQDIAERAVRSGNRPLIFVGLLHQGFHAYAERLPHAQRHEWEKIAGRFEEIVFDQPLEHIASLVSRALNVDDERLPRSLASEAAAYAKTAIGSGWFGKTAFKGVAKLYPLHPMLLPVLVRFFARFGQNERSLFGFLLSNEPFGLQSFALRPLEVGTWYRIPDFFDYVRAVFGHRLAGESYRGSWLRLIELVDRVEDLSEIEIRIVKTVAILNLLDADDLAASSEVLSASVGNVPETEIATVLSGLTKRGVLFKRGQAGGYRLWSASSVNLEAALNGALKVVGEPQAIGDVLVPHLDARPIAARRHYIATGTLRYFQLTYTPVDFLERTIQSSSGADGTIVVALPMSERERGIAEKTARNSARRDVIVVVPEPLSRLMADLRDLQAWQYVISNTPELANDPFALAEAERQVRNSSNRLAANLEAAIGLRSVLASEAKLLRAGAPVDVPRGRQLAGVISSVCDDLYTKAPIVMNELLNRNALSTAAAAARMRLIEGIFLFADKRMLGIDEDRAPPEKSMYLSVLSTGHIHREEKGRFFIDEPPDDRDPLRLKPAISKIMNVLESAKGGRIGVDRLFAELRAQPFGVRDGVSPLLLAIVLSTRSHEIAVYESGTFLHKFGPSDFLRLTKQPDAFECQLCRVVGVRAEVFRRLLDCFSASKPQSRNSDLLDVVGPLCTFAAQLPDFTRRSSQIEGVAIRVRECLLTGQDPSRLIFHQLPEACGIKPFDPDAKRDTKEIEAFVTTLRSATDTLRDTYPALLVAIAGDVGRHLSAGEGNFDRAKLASRAARVSLAVRETRIRTFSLRLRDPGLTPDAWIESLASVVVSKPPAKWTAADLSTWQTQIALLGETFLRVEATAFASGPEPAKTAVRIGITLADGREVARVIETTPEEEGQMGRAIAKINSVLEGSRADRLAILYRLLWESLGGADPETQEPFGQKTELQG